MTLVNLQEISNPFDEKELKRKLLIIYDHCRVMYNLDITSEGLEKSINITLYYLKAISVTAKEIEEAGKKMLLEKQFYKHLPNAKDFHDYIIKYRNLSIAGRGTPETLASLSAKRIKDIALSIKTSKWHEIFFKDPIMQASIYISRFRNLENMYKALKGKDCEKIWDASLLKELESSWLQCYELREHKEIVHLGNKPIFVREARARQERYTPYAVLGKSEPEYKLEITEAEEKNIGFFNNLSDDCQEAKNRYMKLLNCKNLKNSPTKQLI